jgi:hypothetical protein
LLAWTHKFGDSPKKVDAGSSFLSSQKSKNNPEASRSARHPLCSELIAARRQDVLYVSVG